VAKSHSQASAFRAALLVFRLFGHPLRLIVFQSLGRSPMTAGELAGGLPIKRSAVVQHLKLLQAAGLVEASADGRKRVYRVQSKALVPLAHWLKQQEDAAQAATARRGRVRRSERRRIPSRR
jgi:DNA-binding transcriptional ArsR family regulator